MYPSSPKVLIFSKVGGLPHILRTLGCNLYCIHLIPFEVGNVFLMQWEKCDDCGSGNKVKFSMTRLNAHGNAHWTIASLPKHARLINWWCSYMGWINGGLKPPWRKAFFCHSLHHLPMKSICRVHCNLSPSVCLWFISWLTPCFVMGLQAKNLQWHDLHPVMNFGS